MDVFRPTPVLFRRLDVKDAEELGEGGEVVAVAGPFDSLDVRPRAEQVRHHVSLRDPVGQPVRMGVTQVSRQPWDVALLDEPNHVPVTDIPQL